MESLIESAKQTVPLMPDMVNHPPHYISKNGIEVIDVIEAFTEGLNGIEATDTGNVIEYICRWKNKNGLQDLEKAAWYLNHLIERVKREYSTVGATSVASIADFSSSRSARVLL